MIQTKVYLFPNNTFGIRAYAERFAVFKTVDELKTLLKDHQATESQITILGGGSNILLTKDQVGLVLKNELKGIKYFAPKCSVSRHMVCPQENGEASFASGLK